MNSPLMNAMSGRCPVCGEGHAFTGLLKMADRCEVCGTRFDRDPGFFTGATTLPYIFASVWVVALLTFLGLTGLLLQPGMEYWVVGSTVVFVLLVYPPSKRLWLGLYGEWGYLYPDPEPEEPADDAATPTVAADAASG